MTASAAEQEAFVRGFHDRQPGVTARAYAAGQGPDGRSSYDVLADLCAPGDRVLDLGAGDGFLIETIVRRRGLDARAIVAVDLSPGELRAAAARVPDASRVRARAQELPFAAHSFDLVLSHLAFTLMAEPDVVARELARVLVPGGRFAAIVGGGPKGDDAFAGFLDAAQPWLAAAGSRSRAGTAVTYAPRLGDRRARTDDGLAALFAAASGFDPPGITDLPIDLSGAPDIVFERLATAYELVALSDADRAAMRRHFLAASGRWRRADGAIACTMATRLVVARRSIR